ncbi:hypothetical protein CEXT_523281 [Caerostris extrusa]|uniref:Gustatory receptor n=1 Tax=Caerostris extrusa TaxID=172846 RepID=A0AAV4XXT0_CAEEX|nr:hypothetical protein CEXT_523281 [Caerostris extrusa]
MTLSIGKAVTDIRIPRKISDQHDFVQCLSVLFLCASKVSKAFAEVRKSLRDLYQNSLTDVSYKLGNQKRSLMLLQSVIGEEEFYFTAWGFLTLSKSLILSALGALVTYGILLVQFKLPPESI